MKLRNKKTGDIIESEYMMLVQITSNKGERNLLFENLTQLNNEWEDYKPAEPLIKDEKVRNAVRAWAKLNTIESEIFKISMIDRCTLSIGNHGPRFETWNNTFYDNLQRGREYTIAELCGEEEE